MNSIVIYGPPASGKTTHATQFLKHYGLKYIVEEAEYGFKPQPDTLYLSQRPIDEAPKTLRQIPIEVALRSL